MAEGGNEKLLLDAVPLDDAGEYEIPDARPLEQLETYVPSCTSFLSLPSNSSGLQVPNIRLLAQLVERSIFHRRRNRNLNSSQRSLARFNSGSILYAIIGL